MERNTELPTGEWLEILVVMMIVMAVMVMCGGCTRMIYVETVRTDTTEITRWQRDSIWLHDSTHVVEKVSGDTAYVLVERWHTKYVERGTHDSIYIATHDTIPDPYPVEVVKEVPRKVRWWEEMLMWIGGLVVAGGVGWVVLRRLVKGKWIAG